MFRIADILSGLGYVFYPFFPALTKASAMAQSMSCCSLGSSSLSRNFPFGGINNVEFQLGNRSWRVFTHAGVIREPLEAKRAYGLEKKRQGVRKVGHQNIQSHRFERLGIACLACQ